MPSGKDSLAHVLLHFPYVGAGVCRKQVVTRVVIMSLGVKQRQAACWGYVLTRCNPKSASFAVAIPGPRRTFSSCTQLR